ncbi:hypothetical protein [Roseiconus lacunae]|uniref:PEP-CTERM protein-sorting domain-containing protein n=1 Tax=Roseiconus lacunae TaxID=2605694 RepID=A0ABT7PCG7_9BACT|nr:hypothetical protein [Roseiconus lacunae]MDM4014178.1 hypothetical protein [Roseiconus lacunae]
MIPRLIWTSIAIAAMLCGHMPCQAAIVLSFSTDSGASFTNAISTTVGDSVDVELYLRETAGENRLSNDGLIGFGTRAIIDPSFITIRDVTFNSLLFSDFSASSGVRIPSEFSIVGEALIGIDPKGSEILLGAFTVDTNAKGTSEIRFGDFDPRPNRADFAFNDALFTTFDKELFAIDPTIDAADRSRTHALTITAVPEPSSLSFLAILLFALTTLRKRGQDSFHICDRILNKASGDS